MHASSFNHHLHQVLFHCDVPDESIFNMDKDVYNGQLIPIDDIPEDGASIAELSTTPPVATHMTNGV